MRPKGPKDRARLIESIAASAERARVHREPTQLELDSWWKRCEVWGRPRKRKIPTRAERRYRGERANEDKAAIIRREVVRVAVKVLKVAQVQRGRLQCELPASRLAVIVRSELPADIKRPSVRTLRRIIAQLSA
jgi:hypothetical protein